MPIDVIYVLTRLGAIFVFHFLRRHSLFKVSEIRQESCKTNPRNRKNGNFWTRTVTVQLAIAWKVCE